MASPPQTHGWEDFKPRESPDGTPAGRQLFSYDQAIRLDGKRRTNGDFTDWVFVTLRQRSGTWTVLCLDTDCTMRGQGFGDHQKGCSDSARPKSEGPRVGRHRARTPTSPAGVSRTSSRAARSQMHRL